MQLVLLIFVVAVLNLGIGYALAVHFRHGLPTPWATWQRFRSRRRAVDSTMDQVVATEESIQGLEQEPAPSPAASLPAEPEDDSDLVAEPELSDLEALRWFVDKALARLAEFSGHLKKGDRTQSGAWSFVGELCEVCEPYMRHLSEVSERLFDADSDSDQAMAVSDEVEEIILEQVAQLETTLSNLHNLDFDSSMSAAMTRLQMETENTLSVTRRLQQALEAASETTHEPDAAVAAE